MDICLKDFYLHLMSAYINLYACECILVMISAIKPQPVKIATFGTLFSSK